MASIRITKFAGLLPEVNAKLLPPENAQIAHNCLLTDGSLRPQARWIALQEYEAGFERSIRGIGYDWVDDTITMYASFDPVSLRGSPFQDGVTIGAGPGSIVNKYVTGQGLNPSTVAVYGGGVSATVTYQRSYDSNKPVNRLYAVSRVRRTGAYTEEGPLVPITGQNPTDVLYEGDLVKVEINASQLDDGATHVRLYRSISGLDTGQATANENDTKWHLVSEMPFAGGNLITYIDGASATAIPLDMNYSMRFHPPELVARYFGLTEGGWFVAASSGGDIQVSERYLHHAYPVENHLRIPESIRDMAVFMDNVFFGTSDKPYILAVAAADAPMQAGLRPFPESIPCLPGSMTPTASGVLYASGQGLVALSREGQQVLTRQIANAGDTLYRKKVSNGEAAAKISNTTHGRYYAGKYFGFCQGPALDDGVYLTTTLYPVETTEAIHGASEFIGGQALSTEEAVYGRSSFVYGTLRDLVQKYDMPPTEDGSGLPDPGMHIDASSAFVSGELHTILVTTYMPPDSMVPTVTLIGATLEQTLVTTEMRDSMVPTVTLISGTLE